LKAKLEFCYLRYKLAKAKYDSDIPGDLEMAFQECERLRLVPGPPLMVLARVHILLSTQDNDDGTQYAYALEHANTAIRILGEDVRPLVRSNERFPQAEYDVAVRIRDLLLQETAEAKAAADAHPSEAARDDLSDPVAVSSRADDDRHLSVPTTLAASLAKTLGGKTGLRTPVASHTPTGQTEPIATPSAIKRSSCHLTPQSTSERDRLSMPVKKWRKRVMVRDCTPQAVRREHISCDGSVKASYNTAKCGFYVVQYQ
jgi:hypothetical protein